MAMRRPRDYDGWEARLVDLLARPQLREGRATAAGPGYKQGCPRQRVLDAYEALKARARPVPPRRPTPISRRCCSRNCAGAIDDYERLKARAGALDFLDLLLKARDLVRGNAGVRRGFQARFTHIFVDEFQDTDPLQAEILLLLAVARSGAGRLAPGRARPRPPVHRRRSQAVDLSIPPRRRRHLSRRLRAPGRLRREAREAARPASAACRRSRRA